MFTVESIAVILDYHKQRATYGAVAGMLGVPTRSVMQGHNKSALFSWIVNQKTGLPTEYQASQMASDLTANDHIITTATELLDWVRSVSRV